MTSLDKTRRAVVLATVGIVVILGLAIFYVAVIAPLRQTHAVVRSYAGRQGDDTAAETEIARLGGPERAISRLAAYLRLPRWMTANRRQAVLLLWACGFRALPELGNALGDADADVRAVAAWALGTRAPESRTALPALVKALSDADAGVRLAAAGALGEFGPDAKPAIPELMKLLDDASHDDVRIAAVAALKKIFEAPAPDAVTAPTEPEE